MHVALRPTYEEHPAAGKDVAVPGHVKAILEAELVEVLAGVGDQGQAEHALADEEAEAVEEGADCCGFVCVCVLAWSRG